MRIKGYALVIVVLVCLGLGFFSGWVYFGTASDGTIPNYNLINTEGEVDLDFALFWDVWKLVQQKYIDQPVDQKALLYGAIKGIVEALDDPYSAFLDPEETKEFQNELSGKFDGIGAEIGIKNDKLTVIAPLEGMPAEEAGLRAGDWIVAIDDESTVDLSLNDAVSLIRGPRGTTVKLTIVRDSEENGDEPIEIEVTRDKIEVPSIETEDLGDGMYMITVSSFGNDSAREFERAVTSVLKESPKGIILDLRNNAGGLLAASTEILGEFVPEGTAVVTEEFGDGEKREFETEGQSRLEDIPVVVLVNGGSASASEIVAGALRILNNAELVGETTYGKGTVQDYQDLAQKTSIRITVAKWLLPNGEQIPEEGLEPDEEVELTDEDYNNDLDPQLDKAIEVLESEIK